MGAAESTPRDSEVDKDHNLRLVLKILPVIRDLSKQLVGGIKKRDKRYGYLGNIQTSAGILEAYLEEIKAADDAESFEPQIDHLADCLEEIFGDQVIRLTGFKVSKPTISGILIVLTVA